MRCTKLRDWLREVTAYPTPRRITDHLRAELAATEPAPEAGPGVEAPVDDGPRRRHMRRCPRCRERVRQALKYWSLLALFCRDVTPGACLEARVEARIRAEIVDRPALPRPRPALEAAQVAASSEEALLYRDAGGAIPVLGWLLALAGAQGGIEVALEPGENVIGRGPGADIVLDDESLAERHASVVCAVSAAGVAYFVLDHGDGGVFLNGGETPVQWARLEDNDVLRLGAVRFKFKALAGVPVGMRG